MSKELSQPQLFQLGQIYNVIALCTPTEGRDFTLSVEFPDDGLNPTLKAAALTPMGAAWLPFCMQALSHTFKRNTQPQGDKL